MGSGGEGGGGITVDDLEAGQHHEFSGETIVGVVSTLRVSFRHCVEQLEGEKSEGLPHSDEVVAVMVVSRQRRRLGLMGWIWNLRFVVAVVVVAVAAIWLCQCGSW